MSAYAGPEVVTNGLIFSFDMNNTRSWKGMPTTNYVPYPYASYNNGSFVFGYNYANNGVAYTYKTNVSNPVDAPGVLEYYSGTTDYKYFSVDTSAVPTTGTYTFSYYARIVSGSSSSNLNNSQLWRANGTDRSVTGDWNPTFTTEWKRYSTSGPVEAGTVLQYFPIHSGSLTGGITIQYCGFQCELSSFASQFTPSSRSTTQSLIDLTGVSAATVNNLVYNNDNTFQFLYSKPSTVQIPLSSAFNKLEGTISVWIYPTSYNGGNGIFVNNNSTGYNYVDWLWIGPYSDTFYFRLGDGSACCNNDLSFGSYSSIVPLNTWTNLCCTWKSNGTSAIYINGKLYTSRSISAIPSTNPASVGFFGCGHANADGYFNGKMPYALIYNRQLGADEIARNFNAVRRIYNI